MVHKREREREREKERKRDREREGEKRERYMKGKFHRLTVNCYSILLNNVINEIKGQFIMLVGIGNMINVANIMQQRSFGKRIVDLVLTLKSMWNTSEV